jgi:hypothetical protein
VTIADEPGNVPFHGVGNNGIGHHQPNLDISSSVKNR